MTNQSIKKEIEKHLYMILNLAGVKKSIADKIVPVGTERIMDDVVREAFERFIEETMIEEWSKKNFNCSPEKSEKFDKNKWDIAWEEGYNSALRDIRQKQQKWLEENL